MTCLSTAGTLALRLPDWVTPPPDAVAAAELTVLGWGAETGAPAPVAAWRALQWVGADNGTPAPATNESWSPTRAHAVAEFEMSAAIAAAVGFPTPAWFRGLGLDDDAWPDRRWWNTLSGSDWGREVGRGASSALGWLLGRSPDPLGMVPLLYEDGSPVPERERRRWAGQLLARIA